MYSHVTGTVGPEGTVLIIIIIFKCVKKILLSG